MILLSGHSLTAARKVPAEALSLTLTERDSTAAFTPADMTGIGVNSWLRDDTNPGSGIVWRVRSISENYATRTPQIQLEHAVCTLKDRLIFGAVKPSDITGNPSATTCTAKQAVQYILNRQSDWTLGTFDYASVSNPYKFDGDTLYDALETVSNTLGDCWWSYDFSTYPFKLNITQKPSSVASQLRANRNLVAISKTIDKSGMYTRFYPIGKDDLHITGDYVSKNENLYGIVAKVEVDQSLETASELTAWANERLDKHAEPTVTITVDALELADATGESLDRLKLGWKCRIPLEEFGTTITETITKIVYQDKIHQPEVAKVTLANTRTDITRVLADTIKKGGSGGRGSARQQKEDHAWFEDTNDHVAMCAEGIVGVDATGKPNWVRLSQIIVNENGIDAKVQSTQITADENASILSQAGMQLNEYGVLVYADDNVNNVASKINVQADRITAEVTRAQTAEGTLAGQITVEAGKISQIVSAVGSNNQVTAASIVLAINAAGSGAYISADHVYISGNTRINDVFTVISNAVGVTVPMICSSDLTINSNGDLNVYDINLAGSSPITLNATAMAKAIKEAKVEGSGASATLKLIAFDGSEVNFTKAATTALNESWSGGKITVTAQPSGISLERTLASGAASWSGNTATVPINATWGSSGQYSESTGWSVTVNAAARYNAGYDSAHLSGSWGSGSNANLFTVTKVQSGSSNSLTVRVTAGISYNSSTHKYTATAYGNQTSKATATGGTEAYDAGVSSGYSSASPASVRIGSRVTGTVYNCTVYRNDGSSVGKTIDVGSAEYNRGWNAALSACGIPNGGSVFTGNWYGTLYVAPTGGARAVYNCVGDSTEHVVQTK